MIEEIWKEINGFENYSISSLGNVRSNKTYELLKPSFQRKYLKVGLYKSKVGYSTYTIHRLVALHFIDNPENKCQVNHINCNPKDNRLENLEWVTRKENMRHASNMGLLKGKSTVIKSFDIDEIIKIKEMYNNGSTIEEIASCKKVPQYIIRTFVLHISI